MGDVSVPLLHRLIALALAGTVTVAAVELIRRRKLREEYALLWLAASAVLLVLALFPEMVMWVQRKLGVSYLTLMVMASGLFLALIVMHYAVVISRQGEEIRKLAQRIALMRSEMEQATKKDEPATRDPGGPDASGGGDAPKAGAG